jgi:hypothetical protein
MLLAGPRIALVGEAGIVPRRAGDRRRLARHTLTIVDQRLAIPSTWQYQATVN